MNEKIIREQLKALITGYWVHMSYEEAVADFPMDRINETAPNSDYTPYRLLEHIRLTQRDMVEYVNAGEYQERSWPDEYWPKKGVKADSTMWKKSVKGFLADQRFFLDLIDKETTDLTAPLIRNKKHNLFRQIRIIGAHNSYHLGEFGILRQVMGTWPEEREE